MASLQEHKGSVTSVKFLISDRTIPQSLHVISCGADKNLVFRQLMCKGSDQGSMADPLEMLKPDWSGDMEVHVTSVVTSKTPLFDLELDSGGKHVLVACQDACVRVYNVSTGKHSKTLRSNNPNVVLGTIIKVTVDPSGYYVATASTDKSITVFDYYKGDIVASLVSQAVREMNLAVAFHFEKDALQLTQFVNHHTIGRTLRACNCLKIFTRFSNVTFCWRRFMRLRLEPPKGNGSNNGSSDGREKI